MMQVVNGCLVCSPAGEIIPQAACSKYGLRIGSAMALPVRILMFLTFPISWPVSKVLDYVLGGEQSSLFRRKELKALVHIHSRDEAFGGKLSRDEIQIITGEAEGWVYRISHFVQLGDGQKHC